MDPGRIKMLEELKKHLLAQKGENPMPEWVSQLLISTLIDLMEELLRKLSTRRAHRKPKSPKGPQPPVNI